MKLNIRCFSAAVLFLISSGISFELDFLFVATVLGFVGIILICWSA